MPGENVLPSSRESERLTLLYSYLLESIWEFSWAFSQEHQAFFASLRAKDLQQLINKEIQKLEIQEMNFLLDLYGEKLAVLNQAVNKKYQTLKGQEQSDFLILINELLPKAQAFFGKCRAYLEDLEVQAVTEKIQEELWETILFLKEEELKAKGAKNLKILFEKEYDQQYLHSLGEFDLLEFIYEEDYALSDCEKLLARCRKQISSNPTLEDLLDLVAPDIEYEINYPLDLMSPEELKQIFSLLELKKPSSYYLMVRDGKPYPLVFEGKDYSGPRERATLLQIRGEWEWKPAAVFEVENWQGEYGLFVLNWESGTFFENMRDEKAKK